MENIKILILSSIMLMCHLLSGQDKFIVKENFKDSYDKSLTIYHSSQKITNLNFDLTVLGSWFKLRNDLFIIEYDFPSAANTDRVFITYMFSWYKIRKDKIVRKYRNELSVIHLGTKKREIRLREEKLLFIDYKEVKFELLLSSLSKNKLNKTFNNFQLFINQDNKKRYLKTN